MESTIKVLIVDDSAFMRKVVSDMIQQEPRIRVVGTAKNGIEAQQLVRELSPDVVTMDVEMPVMDGMQAVRAIMSETPVPIIMLSTLTQTGAKETMEALEYGAFDFVSKPSQLAKVRTSEVRDELIAKILSASAAKLARTRPGPVPAPVSAPKNFGKSSFRKLIAIGTSTGGPRALQEIIPKLPGEIDAGIVIVQHMPPTFTKTLAERLDMLSAVKVSEAEDGQTVLSGHCYVAPGNRHLKILKNTSGFVIKLDDMDKVNGHRPSVDVMMNSIAAMKTDRAVGVILTGMGSDGSEGLRNMRSNGCLTIAQDEASCVVYGMPKAAVKNGAAQRVVKLSEVAQEIVKSLED